MGPGLGAVHEGWGWPAARCGNPSPNGSVLVGEASTVFEIEVERWSQDSRELQEQMQSSDAEECERESG